MDSCKPKEQMISILQHRMPTSDRNERPLLRKMLRIIIFVLKEKRPHSREIRSSRMREPDFGGFGRKRLAVVSRAARL